MNYYKLLRIYSLISNQRVRALGIGVLYVFRKRFLNIFFDPSLSCNFRCLMCYFSDPNYKKESGMVNKDDLSIIAKNFFRYAVKLQIGCGTEPSTYRHNLEILRLAKEYKVPHVSFTTNAALLNREKIEDMVKAGLDEITISMHGTTKEMYEYLMPGGKFEKLHDTLSSITEIKKDFPYFSLRINYTVNPDNLSDLAYFNDYLEKYSIDTLQIRPIRKIGDSAYSDFDLKRKESLYAELTDSIIAKCKELGVTNLITPKLPNEVVDQTVLTMKDYSYCYISPKGYGSEDFDPEKSSYISFLKRTGYLKSILKSVFSLRRKRRNDIKVGNYDVNI